jgi:hypothetical protein
MSSRARAEIAKLEKRYQKSFKLDHSLVEVRELRDDWVWYSVLHGQTCLSGPWGTTIEAFCARVRRGIPTCEELEIPGKGLSDFGVWGLLWDVRLLSLLQGLGAAPSGRSYKGLHHFSMAQGVL